MVLSLIPVPSSTRIRLIHLVCVLSFSHSLMPMFSRMKSRKCGGRRTPFVVALCEVFVREYELDSMVLKYVR